jgi:GTP-binding protein
MKRHQGARFAFAIGPGGRFPEDLRPEVAFCGRSNVGKSSLLNALTGVDGLARTSKTPGRTRQVHFYEIGADRHFVDLPGYGYAKVSLAERRGWGGLVEGYLARRERIALAVVLVDARHAPFDSDESLAGALAARGVPFAVVLTKCDKLGASGAAASLVRARARFPGAQACLPTSARDGRGIADLARLIDENVKLHPESPRPARKDPGGRVFIASRGQAR